ncbi:MAG: FAD-binding oxidoreductase, partial [Alphaproteobacteria bacterium]
MMADFHAQLEKIVGAAGLLGAADLAARQGWPPYECQARLLVRPATTDAVAAVLALCHDRGQTVVPHGGRTGLVGGASSAKHDIVLSLERMNAIEGIDAVGRSMTLGAGVVLEAAQAAAADAGLLLAADWGAR